MIHTFGPLAPSPGDLQITHRGRVLALKIVAWDGLTPTLSILERKGGPTAHWTADYVAYAFDDRRDGAPGFQCDIEIAEAGGVDAWVRSRLVPAINEMLAMMFTPGPVAPTGTLDAVDAVLQSILRWAPQADGTLRVEAA